MIHTLDLRGWACLDKSWIVGRVPVMAVTIVGLYIGVQ